MEVNTLEECLKLLGAENPFIFNGKELFTDLGSEAYDKLLKILYFLKYQNVISTINISELDKIASLES